MLLTECIACQFGHHDHHTEVIQACPPGMMGGASCPCKGECRNRPRRKLEYVESDWPVNPFEGTPFDA